MSNVAIDFTINLPILGGGIVFLVTIGLQLGKISTKLEYFAEWHTEISRRMDSHHGRISRIEGHLDLNE